MSVYNKSFVYTPAAASAKPGYLKRKFDRIRREQEAAKKAEAARNVVRPIIRKGAKP